MWRHEQVLQYTGVPLVDGIDSARQLIENFRSRFREHRSGLVWAIASRSDDRVIGESSVFRLQAEHRKAEIGCTFGPSGWGHGYAREALTAVVEYLFNDLPFFQLNRLVAETDPRNTPAIRLLESLGFRQEALLREYYFERGQFVDQYIYTLLRREHNAPVGQ